MCMITVICSIWLQSLFVLFFVGNGICHMFNYTYAVNESYLLFFNMIYIAKPQMWPLIVKGGGIKRKQVTGQKQEVTGQISKYVIQNLFGEPVTGKLVKQREYQDAKKKEIKIAVGNPLSNKVDTKI